MASKALKAGERKPGFAALYALVYPMVVEIGRNHGYAMALHGTLARDLDVIAAPWVVGPSEPSTVIADICRELGAMAGEDLCTVPPERGPSKPHREVWTVVLRGGAFLDISFALRTRSEGAEPVDFSETILMHQGAQAILDPTSHALRPSIEELAEWVVRLTTPEGAEPETEGDERHALFLDSLAQAMEDTAQREAIGVGHPIFADLLNQVAVRQRVAQFREIALRLRSAAGPSKESVAIIKDGAVVAGDPETADRVVHHGQGYHLETLSEATPAERESGTEEVALLEELDPHEWCVLADTSGPPDWEPAYSVGIEAEPEAGLRGFFPSPTFKTRDEAFAWKLGVEFLFARLTGEGSE